MDGSEARAFAHRHYGPRVTAVETWRADPGADRALFRLEDDAGQAWVLRLQRRDRDVPAWLGGGGAAAWLDERAALLEWLATADYPAPRLRRTTAGSPVATADDWCGLLVSHLPGDRLDLPDGAVLGAALGRLHALDPGALAVGAWWHPLDHAARFALTLLQALPSPPPAWTTLRVDAAAALAPLTRPLPLPLACIHADAWAGNAIRGPNGEVTLVDWDVAGRGAPILDLGALLGDGFARPVDAAPEPSPSWIAAALDGYLSQRAPDEAEVAALPLAVRFGPAFRVAVRLALAARDGLTNAAERGLAHEAARLAVAGPIARIALAYLGARA